MTQKQQQARAVELGTLCRHLADALGEDALLYRRFARGLEGGDERALTEVMDSLALYPSAVRARVEEALLRWLFDGAQAAADAPSDAGRLTR